jgi:glutamate/tyrosine decarboxylase-like PLP-dependent enzyme
MPSSGSGEKAVLDLLADVAAYSISQADERYLAFPDTGDSVAAVLATIVGTFLNQNLIAFDRSAPAGSVIEEQVIRWLRDLVGFPPAGPPTLGTLGGMWSSGGNMSNHIAVLVALSTKWPEIRRSGLFGLERRPVLILASGVEHFSYLGAAQALGLGAESLVWAQAGSDFRTDAAALAATLEALPDDVEPFMVVGIAGNCRTTAIDDLSAIADIAKRSGLWFHVDACHGGSLLFSDKLSPALAGIERADSVSLDPHKGLFTPYSCSYALFKNPADLARMARYPDRLADADMLDLGLVTPFYGSRGFESLRLWALIHHLGREGIGALVEARQTTFQELQAVVSSHRSLRMIASSDFYRCAFVFLPVSVRAAAAQALTVEGGAARVAAIVSEYTARCCDLLYRSGQLVFDIFTLRDLNNALGCGSDVRLQVMGMAVGHPGVSDSLSSHIQRMLDAAEEALAAEMNQRLLESSVGNAGAQVALGPAGW